MVGGRWLEVSTSVGLVVFFRSLFLLGRTLRVQL